MEPKAAISSDLIRGHIDTIILHTLLDGDKYAQQIIDSVELKSEKQYQLNQATLYSSLKRLENGNFVKSYWYDADGGRRKYIKITDKGVDFVNENLSNWSFSRAIIDKLIDYDAPDQKQFAPVSITGNTDKPYKKAIENRPSDALIQNDNLKTNTIKEPISPTQLNTKNEIQYTPVINAYNADKERNNFTEQKAEDIKEINFRSILNGLIKATAATNEQSTEPQIKEELQPNFAASTPNVVNTQTTQLKFNETISDENVIKREMKNYGGKIDFSDLVNLAEKEGLKIRVSSKNAASPHGKIYKNKLRFFTILTILLLSVLEFFLFFKPNGESIIPAYMVAILFSALGIYSVLSGIIYAKKPNETLPKTPCADKIITCAIIVFNALLITFALNFLLNTDFTNKSALYNYLILPCVFFIDCLIYFVAEYLFSKLSFFKVKLKE